MRNKVGLMLAGGGAKGSYQLGVLKALEERGLVSQIRTASGTSIGSINTLLFMANQKFSYIHKMWNYMDKEYVFNETRDDRHGIYNIAKLVETVTAQIPLKDIRKSKIKGFATTSKLTKRTNVLAQLNIKHMEKVVFNLNTAKYPFKVILASSSIPVLFGYAEIDDEYYVDGGMLDNYPVQPLLDDGCNIILSIPIDPRFDHEQYKDHNILHIDFGAKSIFYKNFFVDLTSAVKFNKEYEDELLRIGYNAGKRIIKKCVTHGFLIRNALGRWVWNKPDGYTYIALSEKEESDIALMQKQIEMSNKEKKLAKYELKNASKLAKKRAMKIAKGEKS